MVPFFTIAPCLNPKIKVEIMVQILRTTGTSIISGTITHNTHNIARDVLYAQRMSILDICRDNRGDDLTNPDVPMDCGTA